MALGKQSYHYWLAADFKPEFLALDPKVSDNVQCSTHLQHWANLVDPSFHFNCCIVERTSENPPTRLAILSYWNLKLGVRNNSSCKEITLIIITVASLISLVILFLNVSTTLIMVLPISLWWWTIMVTTLSHPSTLTSKNSCPIWNQTIEQHQPTLVMGKLHPK